MAAAAAHSQADEQAAARLVEQLRGAQAAVAAQWVRVAVRGRPVRVPGPRQRQQQQQQVRQSGSTSAAAKVLS